MIVCGLDDEIKTVTWGLQQNDIFPTYNVFILFSIMIAFQSVDAFKTLDLACRGGVASLRCGSGFNPLGLSEELTVGFTL